MLTFNKKYFLLTVLLFAIEVFIALYVRDSIIRPYIGDVLIVILIYCFVKIFTNWRVVPVALGVLLFAFAVELLQYLNFVKWIGLADNKTARIIIGTSFSWVDMLTYVAGIAIVLISERVRNKIIRKSTLHLK